MNISSSSLRLGPMKGKHPPSPSMKTVDDTRETDLHKDVNMPHDDNMFHSTQYPSPPHDTEKVNSQLKLQV